MTTTVSDLHLKARLEWLNARRALGTRDDADSRARLDRARAVLDELLDAGNDCE